MDNSKLVYTTEAGRICTSCASPLAACVCRQKPAVLRPADGVIRVRREVKGRGGKTMTAAAGFQLDDNSLQKLAVDLKRRCGAGGSVKNGEILIQGDHRETVLAELRQRGFAAKRAGG